MRLKHGDSTARDDVIARARDRLTRMARKMLRDFPLVNRWEETDDVFQNAAMRLCRTLERVIPEDTCGLMRLAARDIRCALLDLARHYRGPADTWKLAREDRAHTQLLSEGPAEDTHEPGALCFWTEFHQCVHNLPEELQQVVDLIWYHQLSQFEAAEVLQISERTVQRYWRQACIQLHSTLGELPPGV